MQAVRQKKTPVFSKRELFLGRFQEIGMLGILLLLASISFSYTPEGLFYFIVYIIFICALIINDIIILRRNWDNEIDFQVIPYKDSLRTLFFDYSAKRIRGVLAQNRFIGIKRFKINLEKESEIQIRHKKFPFKSDYVLYRSNFDSEEEWQELREKFKCVMQ